MAANVAITASLPDLKHAGRKFLARSQAAAMRLNNTMADFSNLSRGTLTSFATDMRQSFSQGASFAQAFGNATTNALGKVSDKLIQMALDKLWDSAFGGKGGFDIFKLFGLGSGSAGNPAEGAPEGYSGASDVARVSGASSYIHPANFDAAPRFRADAGRAQNMPSGGDGVTVVNISLVSNVDARGANMTEQQFMAILATNNKKVVAGINESLPGQVAAIKADPRKRPARSF